MARKKYLRLLEEARTPSLAFRFGENLSKSNSAVHREVRVRVALSRLKD